VNQRTNSQKTNTFQMHVEFNYRDNGMNLGTTYSYQIFYTNHWDFIF